jgi:hypothetical protein
MLLCEEQHGCPTTGVYLPRWLWVQGEVTVCFAVGSLGIVGSAGLIPAHRLWAFQHLIVVDRKSLRSYLLHLGCVCARWGLFLTTTLWHVVSGVVMVVRRACVGPAPSCSACLFA